jgi:hypothetical protein
MAETVKQSKRVQLINRWGMLETERSSWIDQWRQISKFLLPTNGRYFLEDRDRGNRRFNNILDSTATQALKTLGAGLMAGATSPARPWFRLQTPIAALNSYQPVKVWLDQVTTKMHEIFQQSNLYRALAQIYQELGAFGTAACIILPDFNNVIHCYPLTAGEYCIAQNAQGEVVTIYRRFQMTVGGMVREFGFDKCSPSVQSMYDNGALDSWVGIQHSIEPRYDRDPNLKNNQNMAWGSYYLEIGGNGDRLLRESGFKSFPGVAPRWDVAGGDIYGSGPGMESLGDIKQLQHEQFRKAQGIDHQTNPAVMLPVSLKGREGDTMPGGVVYYEPGDALQGVKNVRNVTLELQYLLQDIQDVRSRINKAFFVDMFLMISNDSNPNMTATEVSARQEEKMLMLGPVFERLSNELYAPIINQTFQAGMDANAFPPPPAEMQGAQITVQYLSVLAQAQKSINTNATDRFVGMVAQLAQMDPEAVDKMNGDAIIDTYGDELGVDPSIIRSDDDVKVLREARSKAQAAQASTANAEQQSSALANLGKVPTSGPSNAASDMLSNLTGYTGAVQ